MKLRFFSGRREALRCSTRRLDRGSMTRSNPVEARCKQRKQGHSRIAAMLRPTEPRSADWFAGFRIFVCFAALLFAGRVLGADAVGEFNQANQLYAQGKFAAAAGAYEQILQSGAVSPALWFNYGNAEFRCGQLGRAIAAYQQARLLAPRDAEVRANLNFVRSQVSGSTWRESRWEAWLGSVSLNEWAVLTALALWVTFILLGIGQIRPALAGRLRGLTRLFGVLTILSAACLGLQTAKHFSESVAVVVSPEVAARSGPFDDAQNVFAVHDGTELAVTDRRNGWLQVTDGAGKIGWLNEKQVEVLPGA